MIKKIVKILKDTFTPISTEVPNGYESCEECNGQGVFMMEKCPDCNGEGIVKREHQD